jgi:hypothetical protein
MDWAGWLAVCDIGGLWG